MKKNTIVIGAGLVGSLLSIYLAKKGHRVTIFERRGDMRREEVEAGRSINLALSDRGIKALEEVGIADEVLKIAIPMHGRAIHQPDGQIVFQPYGKEGQYINSISRRILNERLMDLAEAQGIDIRFRYKCAAIDWNKNSVAFEDADGVHSQEAFDLCFGSDGAYSSARLAHMLQHPRFEYQQSYIDCGYKELSIPAGAGGTLLLEKNALHIWPRKDYMLIALPNTDGSFTGTLFFPFEGELSFDRIRTEDEIQSFFRSTFPDLVPLIPDITQQFLNHPVSALVTVKCFPWIRDDKFSLIGDAAHAIVPFFGQGMNAGFEDCRVLNGLMEEYGDDWSAILSKFQSLRKPDADAIADLAVGNFTEMRARTADPKFLLQKKIEARLHEHFPDKWIPAYTQVTFSPHIRYSEALQNSVRQETIMQEVMQTPGIEQNWNTDSIEALILARMDGID